MNNVKIYTVTAEDLSPPVLCGEGFCVDVVRYSDYAALEAKCAALAAENVDLKAAFNTKEIPEDAVEAFTETAIMDHGWDDTGEWSWVENDTDVIRAVLDALKPETPATDAFLAEVRAQAAITALEKFAQFNIKAIDKDDDEYRDVLTEVARAARIFADKIRKGGAA